MSDPPSVGPHIVQLRAGTAQGAVGLVQAAVAPCGKFANFRVAAKVRKSYADRVEGMNRKRP
ncbi:hypothetical protein HJD18_08120 [Thermoleophilia bacterium SCSIO 60948]|nr:hypothetical protein HJD18_08120 [Thermoleophilia bacterium SCSIO 60948]